MKLIAESRKPLIFILLAGFTALNVGKLYEPELLKYATSYDDLIHFIGPAPEQYRILPYLILKVLHRFVSFSTATSIFNFVCLVFLYPILYARILSSFSSRARWAILILFSLLYPVFMISGYRPTTSLSILLVGCIVAKYGQLGPAPPAHRDLGAFAAYLFLLSLTRADTACFTALFLCIYLRNRLPLLIQACYVALPILTQLVLGSIVFPEATYRGEPSRFIANLSWAHLWFSVPLPYLFLAAALIYPKTFRRLAAYCGREHLALGLLLGIYTVLIMFVARPREFRVYLPFVPMMLMVINDYYRAHNAQEDLQERPLPPGADGSEGL